MTLDPRVARLKRRLLAAPYEICLARARHFTEAYRATEKLDPALRNAIALRRTLLNQQIRICPDERLAGTKTERFLAGPLSVERGDFLRSLQLEEDILEQKRRPFVIAAEDRRVFREEVLPYWHGRTLRDRKVDRWRRAGLIDDGLRALPRQISGAVRLVRYVGRANGRRLLGANLPGRPSLRRLRNLTRLWRELAHDSPAPGIYCFDVQGHLSLGVDRVVERGMAAIVGDARKRLEEVTGSGGDSEQRCFLQAVVISLEAAILYAGRFAAQARQLLADPASSTPEERQRLERIARCCDRVPRDAPRSFHESLQAAWLTLLVGEIQYGTHEVFAVGRLDRYLYPAFHSFDLLLAALRRQLEHSVELLIATIAAKDHAYAELLPAPYVSALTDGCLASARDITRGGAHYDFTSLDIRGLATLVDSLLAIDTLVFQRRTVTLDTLCAILEDDFAGEEALRQQLLHRTPKYGTGEAGADELALTVLRWLAELLADRRNVRGGRYRICCYSYGNHVIDGLLLGATPDGRRRGDPISNGVSPSNLVSTGTGPAGPLRTVARFSPAHASSGIALNMRFHPRLLQSDQGIETFAAMLRTYFCLGGMQLQPNVVSTDTLRKAQAQPHLYSDLVVKVSGYSAYFTDLGRSIQEDIISRHEHDR